MPAYPFKGCCEHGPNAHNKDRCLACDCAKPAVQVQAGVRGLHNQYPLGTDFPVAMPHEEGGIEVPAPDVIKCGLCKALLDPADREAHLDHHERVTNTIANLAAAVAALRHRQED